jgi:5-methylcytosine-specific restriction endonuclease McrA
MELVIIVLILWVLFLRGFDVKYNSREERTKRYHEYLKSEAWQRKRYVVLKRDNWKCRYCGMKATQVHHLKYAKYNIGKEPIDWLVSVCKPCHNKQHQ